ncbi:MAG TPA: Cys-tRNA(Pro) deacylase, partial [Chloroflexota bacterium]
MAKGRVGKGATPAVAALEAAGVDFRLHTYAVDVDVDDYGVTVAHALGVEPGRVHKTLVAKVD